MHHTGMPTWQGGATVEFVIFPVYKFVSVSYITIILESGAVGKECNWCASLHIATISTLRMVERDR